MPKLSDAHHTLFFNRLSRDPVDTDFACVSVTELNNFITALPNWAETRLIHEITRILQHQFADGPQINAIALSRKEWKVSLNSLITSFPTDPFTFLEPHNPSIEELYEV